LSGRHGDSPSPSPLTTLRKVLLPGFLIVHECICPSWEQTSCPLLFSFPPHPRKFLPNFSLFFSFTDSLSFWSFLFLPHKLHGTLPFFCPLVSYSFSGLRLGVFPEATFLSALHNFASSSLSSLVGNWFPFFFPPCLPPPTRYSNFSPRVSTLLCRFSTPEGSKDCLVSEYFFFREGLHTPTFSLQEMFLSPD